MRGRCPRGGRGGADRGRWGLTSVLTCLNPSLPPSLVQETQLSGLAAASGLTEVDAIALLFKYCASGVVTGDKRTQAAAFPALALRYDAKTQGPLVEKARKDELARLAKKAKAKKEKAPGRSPAAKK